ncbi:MAG: hypothetical protein ABI844_04895 [Saprospiraceae bacterium]
MEAWPKEVEPFSFAQVNDSKYLHVTMLEYKSWIIEIIWLLATAVLAVLVVWPIRQEIYGFPFERSNIYFIFMFVTGLRWLLFLASTPFRKNIWIKFTLIFLSIWVIIFSVNRFALFQTFIDEKGIESISMHLSEDRQIAMSKYISSEFIFFAIGTIIVCGLLPFRMIASIWRTHNLNKV